MSIPIMLLQQSNICSINIKLIRLLTKKTVDIRFNLKLTYISQIITSISPIF